MPERCLRTPTGSTFDAFLARRGHRPTPGGGRCARRVAAAEGELLPADLDGPVEDAAAGERFRDAIQAADGRALADVVDVEEDRRDVGSDEVRDLPADVAREEPLRDGLVDRGTRRELGHVLETLRGVARRREHRRREVPLPFASDHEPPRAAAALGRLDVEPRVRVPAARRARGYLRRRDRDLAHGVVGADLVPVGDSEAHDALGVELQRDPVAPHGIQVLRDDLRPAHLLPRRALLRFDDDVRVARGLRRQVPILRREILPFDDLQDARPALDKERHARNRGMALEHAETVEERKEVLPGCRKQQRETLTHRPPINSHASSEKFGQPPRTPRTECERHGA